MLLQENDISLRPLQESDAEEMTSLANNKKIFDNLRDVFPYPYQKENASTFIASVQKQAPPLSTFAVNYQNKFCGIAGLTAQKDVFRKNAEIGYWIGEPFWNKEVSTVVVKILIQYGFEQLGFARIFAGVFEYNIASMRVLEKNGFQKEGVFKKAVFKNNQFWDNYYFAKLNPAIF